MTALKPDDTGTPGTAPICGCCKSRGKVLDIEGNPRPCSRCRPSEEFGAWYEAKLAAERGEA